MTRADWEARGQRWWSHVLALADDSMEGRETGSAGFQRAADYVSRQFREAGLEAGGTRGYLQPVELKVSQLDEASSSLSWIRGGVAEPLRLREDAQFVTSSETVPDVEAEAVFVGYGLDIPEYAYNDFDGLDLRGKIAVYVRGGPSEIPGAIKAHYQSVDERLRTLRRHGAVGSVITVNPNVPDLPWPRLAAWLTQPRMELREATAEEARPLSVAIYFNPERLDRLLTGSGHSASEIMALHGGPGPLPRFPLVGRLRAHAVVRRSTAQCSNVVGVRRGSDPELGREIVVGSAHLDHLGVGEPINGDPIYSGAMDNASGVATLIEIARSLNEMSDGPRRTVVFVAVTGEEKGLLGSEYFAKHPSVPGSMVADLNMDMFLPLYPLKYLEIQGLGESTLGGELREIAARSGVEVHSEYEPERVLFIRSDQYNFVKAGVPSLMLSIGYEKGSSEEQTSKDWFRDRYHSPADDTDQPIDLVAAAQFTALLGRLMAKIANDEQRPNWNPDSFFRRFAL